MKANEQAGQGGSQSGISRRRVAALVGLGSTLDLCNSHKSRRAGHGNETPPRQHVHAIAQERTRCRDTHLLIMLMGHRSLDVLRILHYRSAVELGSVRVSLLHCSSQLG